MLQRCCTGVLRIHRSLNTSKTLFNSGRKILVHEYPLRTRPGKTVSIQVAEFSDLNLIQEYSERNFSAEEPSSVSLSMDPKVMNDQLISKIIASCLEFPFSTLAFDGDKLIGYNMVSLEVIDDHSSKLEREIPEDFGPIFEEYARTFGITDKKVADITGTVYYASNMVSHFLPKGRKHVVAHGEMGSVMKEYKGYNLVAALIVEGAKHIAKTNLCEYYYATATAAATAHLNPQIGLFEVWSVKFKKIKVGGRRVFDKDVMYDGADRVTINLGRVEDVAHTDYLDYNNRVHIVHQSLG